MNTFFMLLFDDDALPSLAPLSKSATERWLVIGAILLVITSVFVWAAFIRKRRRRKERRHYRRSFAKRAAEGVSEIRRQVHERQRRRRSRQRTRNPTLAETGGLPPARADELPSQPQSQLPS